MPTRELLSVLAGTTQVHPFQILKTSIHTISLGIDGDHYLNAAGPSGPFDEDEELEFEDEEQLATVTVIQNFDISGTGEIKNHRSEGNDLEDESEDRGRPLIPQPESKQISSSHPTSSTRKRKGVKKRPAYETKAARTLAKEKQKARHNEKMERGRSKSKSGPRSRSKRST